MQSSRISIWVGMLLLSHELASIWRWREAIPKQPWASVHLTKKCQQTISETFLLLVGHPGGGWALSLPWDSRRGPRAEKAIFGFAKHTPGRERMYVTVQLCVRKSHERVGVRGRFLKLQVRLTDSEAHFTTSHRFSRLMWKNNFPAIPCRKSVPFLFWAIIILFFMSSALVHRSLFNFNLRNHRWSNGVFPLATMESEASGKPSNSLAALVFVLATKGLLICCPSSLNLWAFSWVFMCFLQCIIAYCVCPSLPIPKALIAVVLLLAAAAHGEIPGCSLAYKDSENKPQTSWPTKIITW